jgi:hypothetical protein
MKKKKKPNPKVKYTKKIDREEQTRKKKDDRRNHVLTVVSAPTTGLLCVALVRGHTYPGGELMIYQG